MLVLPPPSAGIGGNLIAWTVEDQEALEFRYRSHYKPRANAFSCYVAIALEGDESDAAAIWRAVVSCNTLREFPGMRTDWLIEECGRLKKA